MLSIAPVNKSKFFLPELPSDYVDRRRLMDIFDPETIKPVVLVSAAGGFGKSTLVSAWLRKHKLKNAWLSLSERDDDRQRFILYLIAAIQQQIKDFGRELLELNNAPQIPSIDVVREFLLSEISSISKSFFLVLDDYHHIRNSEIHNLISEIFRFPQPYFHLIIISRNDPALPCPEWRAKNLLEDIRSEDLRFTESESKIFIQQATSNHLTDNKRDKIIAKADGWISGLRLQLLSTELFKDKEAPGTDKNSSDSTEQLINNVINSQEEVNREYLLKLSLLEEFNPELFSDVCLSGELKNQALSIYDEFLVDCLRYNMFIVALDDVHKSYRFHHMFRDMLHRKALVEIKPKELKTIYFKIAQFYFKENRYYHCIDYFLKGEHVKEAIDAFNNIRQKLIYDYKWHDIELIIDLFPDKIIQSSSILLLSKGWNYAINDNLPQMASIIPSIEKSMADETFVKSEEKRMMGEFYGLKSYTHYAVEADPTKCLKYSLLAIDLLSEDSPNMLGLAWTFYGAIMQVMNKSDEAQKKILTEIGNSGRPVFKAQLLITLCYMNWLDADLVLLEKHAKLLLDLGEQSEISQAKAHGYYYYGLSKLFQNKFHTAQESLQIAFDLRHHTFQMVHFYIYVSLAYVHHELGNHKEKVKILQLIDKDAHNKGGIVGIKASQAIQVELNELTGNGRAQRKWAMETDYTNVFPFIYAIVPEYIQAKILARENDTTALNKSAEILEHLLPIFKIRNSVNFIVRVRILKSVISYKLEDKQDCWTSLEKSFDSADHGMFIKPFVEQGKIMQTILTEYKTLPAYNPFANDLLKFFNEKTVNINITQRELQILKLLEQNLSNKEIAQKLFIAEKTVKRHLLNINKKLHSSNRLEAVKKAKESGII